MNWFALSVLLHVMNSQYVCGGFFAFSSRSKLLVQYLPLLQINASETPCLNAMSTPFPFSVRHNSASRHLVTSPSVPPKFSHLRGGMQVRARIPEILDIAEISSTIHLPISNRALIHPLILHVKFNPNIVCGMGHGRTEERETHPPLAHWQTHSKSSESLHPFSDRERRMGTISVWSEQGSRM